jgi:hypothetical protein
VLGDGDDIGARHLGDGDTAVGLVGRVEVDVVGADTGGDGELELLRLGETLGGQVAGVEAAGGGVSPVSNSRERGANIRSRDDDLGIDELAVKGRVLAVLVGGGDERVALVLEPFADTELVLGGSQESRDLLGVDATLDISCQHPWESKGECVRRGEGGWIAHVVEDCQNFDLWVKCLR